MEGNFATSNFFYNLITVELLTIVIMRPFTPGWYFARAQERQNIRDAFHDRYFRSTQERQFKLEIQAVRLSLVSRTLSYDNKIIFPSFLVRFYLTFFRWKVQNGASSDQIGTRPHISVEISGIVDSSPQIGSIQ